MNDHYRAMQTTSPEGEMHLAREMRRSGNVEAVNGVLTTSKTTGEVLITMQLCIRTDVWFDEQHLQRHVEAVREWADGPELADRIKHICRRAGTWVEADQ